MLTVKVVDLADKNTVQENKMVTKCTRSISNSTQIEFPEESSS